MRAVVVWVARLLLGLTVLALVSSRIDFSALTLQLDAGALWGGAVAVLALVLAQALSAQRWRILLGEGAPPWRYLWRLYSVGAFFSLFLPTAVGGDAVRAAAAMRTLPRGGSVLASVLLDRMLGVLALVVYAMLGAIAMPAVVSVLRDAWRWKFGAAAVLALVAGAVMVAAVGWRLARRRPHIATMLDDGLALAKALIAAPRALLGATALAFAVQGAYIVAWIAVAIGLRLPIPLLFFLVAVPVVSLASMLPVTLSGIGVREGAWVLLFASLGLPAANAVAYSLLYFACVMLVGLVGGVVFVSFGTGRSPIEGEER